MLGLRLRGPMNVLRNLAHYTAIIWNVFRRPRAERRPGHGSKQQTCTMEAFVEGVRQIFAKDHGPAVQQEQEVAGIWKSY